MFKSTKRTSIITKNPLPSPDSTCASDAENEIAQELVQKRLQLDHEIEQFQAQKEKEFREFEEHLRTQRKQKPRSSVSKIPATEKSTSKDHSRRTSSSSALDLLAGHGISRCTTTGSSSKARREKQKSTKHSVSPQAGPSPSKPTLSLEALNIEGKTCPQSQTQSAATPKLLSRNLSQTSLSSGASTTSVASSPPSLQPDTLSSPSKPRKARDPFVGVLTPSYLPLLDSGSNSRVSTATPLVTPPTDDEYNRPETYHVVALPNGILPLQSSSFPPHGTTLKIGSSATKRAYTAPSASRMPSALRSASAGNLAKKRKHVTFRLADSAIVDPSSSYEEGPSPLEGEKVPVRSKSASAVSHSSKTSNGLRYSTAGMRNGLIGDHTRSDEEDEAAGVKPGMSMDEVMQKLNEFNASNAHGDDVTFGLEDEEDVGWTDTKYHEDEEDETEDDNDNDDDNENDSDEEEEEEDDDEGENPIPGTKERHDRTIKPQDTDSYFALKFNDTSNIPAGHPSAGSGAFHIRDRSGSSPLTPIRDHEWDSLSSSDKDRLLFSRRKNEDSDSDQSSRTQQAMTSLSRPLHTRSSSSRSSFIGMKKSGSTNSLSSLTSLSKLGANQQRSSFSGISKLTKPAVTTPPASRQPKFEDDLKPSIDGGSGIGFFELDEELASPGAAKVRSSGLGAETDIDLDRNDADVEADESSVRESASSDVKSGFTGASSVPINIVRPSASVSSSWVGTFGH